VEDVFLIRFKFVCQGLASDWHATNKQRRHGFENFVNHANEC